MQEIKRNIQDTGTSYAVLPFTSDEIITISKIKFHLQTSN